MKLIHLGPCQSTNQYEDDYYPENRDEREEVDEEIEPERTKRTFLAFQGRGTCVHLAPRASKVMP